MLRTRAFLIGFILIATVSLARASDPTSTAVVTPGHLYDRIAVIGASVSDGFGVFIRDDVAADDLTAAKSAVRRVPSGVNLSDVLRASVPTAPGPIIHHYASGFFFSSPGTVGKSEIDRALGAKPTLVLAVDFLFWYVYGTVNADGEIMQSEAARVANLEMGLSQLDRVLAAGVPLIIGDLPDMRGAIGKMLSKNQVPAPETLDAVNTRITAWVATRPAVKLLALRTLLTALKAGGTLEVAGRVWDPATLGALLQNDQLHPTFCGTVIIAAGLIDLARTNDASALPPFVFEPSLVAARALESKQSKAASKKKPVGATADPPPAQ
ncbi:MAG: hypothetical protein EXS17_05170 [Phycisphaerales bacterium]|nr:hypothetical protein [Phycisphaerales bacterium]